jgi:hypothetical protein
MPTQRNVAVQFWISPGVRSVPPTTKLFALYCMTSPHSNLAGVFTLSWDDCQDHTGLRRRQILQAIGELSQPQGHDGESFLEYDARTRLLWVRKRLQFEFPSGQITAKQEEGIRRILEVCPRCPLLRGVCEGYKSLGTVFATFLDHHLNGIANPITKAIPNGIADGIVNGTDSGSRLSSSGSRLSAPSSQSPDPRAEGQGFSPDGFEEFWRNYPKKVAKQDALRAWKKLPLSDGLLDQILSALKAHKQCAQWQKDGGAFIPFPATWLNGKRWEDEVPGSPGDGTDTDAVDPRWPHAWPCGQCGEVHEGTREQRGMCLAAKPGRTNG